MLNDYHLRRVALCVSMATYTSSAMASAPITPTQLLAFLGVAIALAGVLGFVAYRLGRFAMAWCRVANPLKRSAALSTLVAFLGVSFVPYPQVLLPEQRVQMVDPSGAPLSRLHVALFRNEGLLMEDIRHQDLVGDADGYVVVPALVVNASLVGGAIGRSSEERRSILQTDCNLGLDRNNWFVRLPQTEFPVQWHHVNKIGADQWVKLDPSAKSECKRLEQQVMAATEKNETR